jgi:TetR/AcrR family transcriptional regulator, repressor for uid operon
MHEAGDRVKDRRKQVLDAAAECFCEMGFHGCSIARISKIAGMSPGHIYYHFANKEEIVEALVLQQENTLTELIKDISSSPPDEPLAVSLKKHTPKMVKIHTESRFIGLWLEIAAEACRNKNISRLLCESQRNVNARFNDEVLRRTGVKKEETDIQMIRIKLDMIAAIFNGLSQRTAISPTPKDSETPLLVNVIDNIIDLFFSDY